MLVRTVDLADQMLSSCASIKSLSMPTGKLHIVPLGGLGEFGMNCMAVRWGDDIIVIDAGLMFPEVELLLFLTSPISLRTGRRSKPLF